MYIRFKPQASLIVGNHLSEYNIEATIDKVKVVEL